MSTFSGFMPPVENWSRLPHELIAALPIFETKAELAVVLYILRHTWGFNDDNKKITLDEFENGRKKANGERIDNGVGMTKPSIVDGLKRAEKHGFIDVETDDSDKARIEKFYSLQMLKDLTPGDVKRFNTGGKEILPRSEKETIERTKDSRDKPAERKTSKKASARGEFTKSKFYAVDCTKRIIYTKSYAQSEVEKKTADLKPHGLILVRGDWLNTDAQYETFERKQTPQPAKPLFDAFAQWGFGLDPRKLDKSSSGRIAALRSAFAGYVGKTPNDADYDKDLAARVRTCYLAWDNHPKKGKAGLSRPKEPTAFLSWWEEWQKDPDGTHTQTF